MKVIGKIYFVGICVLVAAIFLNYIAPKIGLMTWYVFFSNYDQVGIISYIWLFIIYPFSLGIVAYIVSKKIK